MKDLNKLSKDELVKLINSTGIINEVNIDSTIIDYRALLEATSDIIFVLDKKGNLIYRNSAWKIVYPSSSDDELGDHFSLYLPDFERERATYVFDTVIENGTVFENELMKTYDENGTVYYFIISFSPIRSGDEIIGLIGIMKNITDRLIAEKKLRANTQLMEEKVKEQIRQSDELSNLRDFNLEIINNAPIGIFMMDPTGIMLSENDALKKIMGRTPEETVVGVNLMEQPGFQNAGFDKLFEEGLVTKKTIRSYHTPYLPISAKKELIINVTMTPLLDKTGKVDKTIIMVEDHTDEAKAQKKANWAQRFSAVGGLASGIAEEVKKPIGKMIMDLSFIENNIDRDNRAFEYIQEVKQEVNNIKHIAEQLHSLSGSYLGKGENEDDFSEINKLFITHPLDMEINKFKGLGFDINITLPKESYKVVATHNQMHQILSDLIENAVEAMDEPDEVKVNVYHEKTDEGEFVIIDVIDKGVGIPMENMQKIFQPFFSTKGEGATGLGLMITSTVIENLGGKIGMKSEPGVGTTVRLAVPVLK